MPKHTYAGVTVPTIPVIPAEVADAIEWKRNRSDGLPKWTNEDFIEAYLRGIGDTQKKLRAITFDTLLSALINGYTREKTAEELADEERQQKHRRIREVYESNVGYTKVTNAFAEGIVFAINTLNIGVLGVNRTETKTEVSE